MSKHFHILSRLVNVPLLLEQTKFETITSNVSMKLLMEDEFDDDSNYSPTHKGETPSPPSMAIIKVFDTLVSKNGTGASGSTSYESISNQIDQAVASKVKSIGFYCDSPGGEALGNFPLASKISQLPKLHGIKTFSFTDGMMTSGAYSIAAACQKVYATEVSKIGSIAAIACLVDFTEMDKEKGIKYHFIRTKSDKALYNPHDVVNEKVLDSVNKDMEMIDSGFNKIISTVRPQLTIEKIKEMKGGSFSGTEALELGLVDKLVQNFDEVLAIESNSIKSSTGKTMTPEEIAALQAKIAEQNVQIATLKGSIESIKQTGIVEERQRCLKIIEAGVTFKVSAEAITKSIEKGRDLETAVEIFEEVGSKTSDDTSISTFGTIAKVTANPIGDSKFFSIEDIPQDLKLEIMSRAMAGESVEQLKAIFGVN